MASERQLIGEIDLTKRCDFAMLAGIRRVIVDIEAGFRVIEIQRTREKTHTWLEEMAWLLDGIQNSEIDGLEFMLSTKTLDTVSLKAMRTQITNIRKDAKADLVETYSPAVGATIFFELHHDRLKEIGQNVIKNLTFIALSLAPHDQLAGKGAPVKNEPSHEPKVH